ncbi:MAG: redoxin domain-containing protein [Nitrospinota bacterium]
MELQERLEAIRERGTEVVAISTDDALKINLSLRELRVTFPLISDPQRRVVLQFGVLHPQEGFARPAVFLIDKRGVVRLAYVGKDYSDRPPIEAILNALAYL